MEEREMEELKPKASQKPALWTAIGAIILAVVLTTATNAYLLDRVARERNESVDRDEQLSSDVSDLRLDIAGIEGNLGDYLTEVVSIQNRIIVLQSDMTDLQSHIINLQSNMTSLGSNVTDIQDMVNDLQSWVAELQAAVNDLWSVIGDLQNQITNLESLISSMNMEIADVKSRITDLESQMANLSKDVENLRVGGPFSSLLIFLDGFESGLDPIWNIADHNSSNGLDYWGIYSNSIFDVYDLAHGNYSIYCAAMSDTGPQSPPYDNGMIADLFFRTWEIPLWTAENFSAIKLTFSYYQKVSDWDGLSVWASTESGPGVKLMGGTMYNRDTHNWIEWEGYIPLDTVSVGFVFASDETGVDQGTFIDDVMLVGYY